MSHSFCILNTYTWNREEILMRLVIKNFIRNGNLKFRVLVRNFWHAEKHIGNFSVQRYIYTHTLKPTLTFLPFPFPFCHDYCMLGRCRDSYAREHQNRTMNRNSFTSSRIAIYMRERETQGEIIKFNILYNFWNTFCAYLHFYNSHSARLIISILILN